MIPKDTTAATITVSMKIAMAMPLLAAKSQTDRLRSIAHDDRFGISVHVGVDFRDVRGIVGVFILVVFDDSERFGFFLSEDWLGAPTHVRTAGAGTHQTSDRDRQLCRPAFRADRRRPVQVVEALGAARAGAFRTEFRSTHCAAPECGRTMASVGLSVFRQGSLLADYYAPGFA